MRKPFFLEVDATPNPRSSEDKSPDQQFPRDSRSKPINLIGEDRQ